MNAARKQGRARGAAIAFVACALLASGCDRGSGKADTSEGLPYEPFDKPVTLSIAYSYSDIELPEGDMRDNNFLTRYLQERTGVVVKYEWEAGGEEQYTSKLDLAIRSNDLPDAFLASRDQFHTLVERGMIEDLTSYYEPYASELVKSIYDATGGKAIREASVNGKLYAMPNVAIAADAPSYVWVRQDWLDKLKLEPPRTLDDVARIAKAFVEQDPDGNGKDDTSGIPVDTQLVFAEKMGIYGLNGVFSAYHAFPKRWIRDDSGNVVYGSIAPEAKEALARLADWYKEGIIDRQFVLRKDVTELVTTNQAGIIFGPWWAPYWPLSTSVAKDTKAEWRVYAAPVDGDGLFVTNTSPATDRYLVVRKGYAHPEAAIKVLNVLTRLERNRDPHAKEVAKLRSTATQHGTQLRSYYPFDLLLDYPDAIEQRHDLLVKALAEEVGPDELDGDTRTLYGDAIQEMEAPRKNMEAWSSSQAYLLGGEISKLPMVKKDSVFYGTTPSMDKYWAGLQQLEHDTYLKIITGELPIDAFDAFATRWKQGGGDRITAEVAKEAAGAGE